jgi:CheY-like chemotaxis protein
MTRKHILLIDDDELLCDVLTSLLELEEYEVTTAGNGQEGLKQLSTGRFDLILLDLLMPVMDGIRFLRVAGELKTSAPPVLVLSASATADVIEALSVSGVVGVMRKPVQPRVLLEKLAQIFRGQCSKAPG